jgi:Flp pilus assembly protein TadB
MTVFIVSSLRSSLDDRPIRRPRFFLRLDLKQGPGGSRAASGQAVDLGQGKGEAWRSKSRRGIRAVGKMMVMQSLAWAAAIIVVALLGGPPMAPILLAVLGTLALGRLRLDAKRLQG